MAPWAKAAQPVEIVVTGHAATVPVTVSGRAVAEDPAVARTRADDVAEALVRVGLPKARIVTRTELAPDAKPEVANGLPEASRRRVTTTMRMASVHAAQD